MRRLLLSAICRDRRASGGIGAGVRARRIHETIEMGLSTDHVMITAGFSANRPDDLRRASTMPTRWSAGRDATT
jgi:hypothetical protein